MVNNLIVGSSSQIAQYMPLDYIRISSRNINIKNITNNKYNRIFICFGEQRTCNKDLNQEFININFDYTISLINKLKNYCNNIVVYSTAELWNNISGPIDLSMSYDYIETPYIKSKEMLCKEILTNKNLYNNIIFNFNRNIHMTSDIIIILCVFILIFLFINCFLIGYIVGLKNRTFENQNTNKYSLNELIKSNKKIDKSQTLHNTSIDIDESKVVVSIETDNLEKKYTQLGDIKKSSENISSSIDKLKNIKK